MSEHTGAADIRFVVGTTTARFRVQRDERSGVYPDWTFTAGERTRKIPGSNRSVTWFDGWALSRISLPVWFDTRAEYRTMLTLTGQTGVLHLLANFTSHEGDRYHDLGRDYERYADTTLIEAPQNVRMKVGEVVECELVFARAFAPVVEV